MKVAVVGAGIGGLCLAQGLARAGLDVTVYERDSALDSRAQGYRLHLHAGSALHACLPADLYELCIATAGRPSTVMTVVTKRLRLLRRIPLGLPTDPSSPSSPSNPADPLDPKTLSTSVNRQTFREVLAARLDDVIEFGRVCTGFSQSADGVRVRFADGTEAFADVLVAADGVGSAIRQQYLPQLRVQETGSICVYGRTPLTDRTRPLVPAATWDGFTAVVGRGVGMATGVLEFRQAPPAAASRLAPDVRLSPVQPYLMWALTGTAERFAGPLDGLGPIQLHAAALATMRRWHPDLRRLVEYAIAEETALVPIRSAVPIERWQPSRVTLLGDAVHAMSPARGSGANTALRDAALLASELAAAERGEKELVQAIGDYEREMTDYGFEAVRASLRS
ncbi:FAD-dependent oxidoreductase [Actinospica robiniae]|uniref:FAD-dependent oxidoreductase n=1 Tax=Actinospica robiniae TaxID=304901 RepID=UPI00041FD146|nr:FAD-dependent oxidoreductase [Actinospica robiniae]